LQHYPKYHIFDELRKKDSGKPQCMRPNAENFYMASTTLIYSLTFLRQIDLLNSKQNDQRSVATKA